MRAGEKLTRARNLGLTDDADVACLRTLWAFLDLVLDLRAFGQALEALAGDRAEVNEDVVAAVGLRDEAVALRIVEPLHGSGCHVFHLPAPSRTCSGGVIALPVLALDDLWRATRSAWGLVRAGRDRVRRGLGTKLRRDGHARLLGGCLYALAE